MVALVNRRSSREANAIAALKILVGEQGEQLNNAKDELRETRMKVEKLSGRVSSLEEDLEAARAEADSWRSRFFLEKHYTRVLREHIWQQLPPPSPGRP